MSAVQVQAGPRCSVALFIRSLIDLSIKIERIWNVILSFDTSPYSLALSHTTREIRNMAVLTF